MTTVLLDPDPAPATAPAVPGPPGPRPLPLRSAAVSVGGAGREDQDAGCAGSSLLAVADGVGGAAGGATASAVVVAALAGSGAGGPTGGTAGLRRAVAAADRRLGAVAAARPELRGMATTLTALALDPRGEAAVAHVGDSRAYLWRAGRLQRLTADQTFVQALVDAGALPEEAARSHPLRSVLLAALRGEEADLADLAVSTVRLHPGDRLLLCTDGVSGAVPPELLSRVLGEEHDPAAAAARLLRAALAAGARDDVTAVVAAVERVGVTGPTPLQTVGAARPWAA
ncbi:PP2C family protein-serine/threonine phosphatase [Geodermatophilus sp. URMC 63]